MDKIGYILKYVQFGFVNKSLTLLTARFQTFKNKICFYLIGGFPDFQYECHKWNTDYAKIRCVPNVVLNVPLINPLKHLQGSELLK